ncbi:hypothetical protein NDU88_000328 [Pleurodeles waltl]|uniref:Uncharacterized protein n=1 Tax=Pleurodeles waltl TaxID=8319 RepID=A0AAV7S9A7_PLEWA|nr:hypothetical protein NDU88_000328 [Pleurodeles waltl]
MLSSVLTLANQPALETLPDVKRQWFRGEAFHLLEEGRPSEEQSWQPFHMAMDSADPSHRRDDNDNPFSDAQALQEADDLDNSSHIDMNPSLGPAPTDMASIHSVLRKAVELQFPTVDNHRNILMDIFQMSPSASESLLPFNEALIEIINDSCLNPSSSSAVHGTIARWYYNEDPVQWGAVISDEAARRKHPSRITRHTTP